MDTRTKAARVDLTLVEGEDYGYVVELMDWGGEKPVRVSNAVLSGFLRGIRGEERWDVEVRQNGAVGNELLLRFPEELRAGMYYVEVWGEWEGQGRLQLVEGIVGVEVSRGDFKAWAQVEVPRRVVRLRLPDGQGGRIRAEVMAVGVSGANALRAEDAAGRADESAAEAKASEIVAKAAEAVAEKCREIVEAAQEEVERMKEATEEAAEAAAQDAEAAEGSAGEAERSAAAAAGSARDAALSATGAEKSASAAKGSEDAAGASAQDAQRSATSAAGSAAAAKGSEDAAALSAAAAEDAAGRAAADAGRADASAEAAERSAAAAKGSEEGAAGSAAAAEAAAEGAKKSEEAAASSEAQAKLSAGEAGASAAEAAESAESAGESAVSAGESAASAGRSAMAAADSASAAEGSKVEAGRSEASAAASAETAQEAMGKASFELWQENGHEGGSVAEYLEDLRGDSAYEVWLGQGNEGSEDDFLRSLKGKDGLSTREELDEVYEQIVDADRVHGELWEEVMGKAERGDVYERGEVRTAVGSGDGDARYVQLGVRYGVVGLVEEVRVAVRSVDSYFMAHEGRFFGVFEDVDGGLEVFERVGVSREAVVMVPGGEAVWSFRGMELHGRAVRLVLLMGREDGWPGDGDWDGIGGMGVRMSTRGMGDEGSCCVLGDGTVSGFVAEVRMVYVGEGARFAPVGHVGDEAVHLREGEREVWNGKADQEALESHVGDGVRHVTAGERAAWNGKADKSALDSHVGDGVVHVTAGERAAWNGKADRSALESHVGNGVVHVTAGERNAWNGKAEKEALESHVGDEVAHVTASERTKWNGAVTAVGTKAEASALAGHVGDGGIHLTAAEKTKVGSIIKSPLVIGPGEANAASTWLYHNSQTITRSEDKVGMNLICGAGGVFMSNNCYGCIMMGYTSKLVSQDAAKTHFIDGVTMQGGASSSIVAKPHTSNYSTVLRGVHSLGTGGQVLSLTADDKIQTSGANNDSLYNQGVVMLGYNSYYVSPHANIGVIVAGFAATLNVPNNQGIILASTVQNKTHGTYGAIDAKIGGVGIALIGGAASTIQVSSVVGTPTQVKGYMKFLAGSGVVDRNGAAVVSDGVWQGAVHAGNGTVHITAAERTAWNGLKTSKAEASALTSHVGDAVKHVTAAERTGWNGKLGCSVGGVKDVRYYTSAAAAPALSAREEGVLYLIGE